MKIKNTGPRRAWSEQECAEVIDVYFSFLSNQINEIPYQKAKTVREVAVKIGRTKGSVEAKMMNISGVLRDMEYPYVTGYKPLGNGQKLLKEMVISNYTISTQKVA